MLAVMLGTRQAIGVLCSRHPDQVSLTQQGETP
jgi:hypothetical protein